MSEHTPFLNLVATSLDFPLEPAETTALARHLDGCDTCRSTADALRADATRLRSLPRRSPPPHIAAVIARAARGESRTGRPPLMLLGLGFLLLLGLAGAVVGGGLIRQALLDRQAPPSVVAPSATPSSALVLPLPSGPQQSFDPRLGVEWQVVDGANAGGASTSVDALAVTAGGPGFVAVGRTCRPQPGGDVDCWGGPQVSSDGMTWQAVPRQPSLEIGAYYPTSGPGADMIGVASRPGAIVAIGYAVDGARAVGQEIPQGGIFRPAVWLSPDGRTWERMPHSPIFERARFHDIAATDAGFVIVGAVYTVAPLQGKPRGAIWTSPDGRAWQRVPDDSFFDIGGYQDTGEDPGSGGPKRVIAAGSGVLAMGAVCNEKGLACVTAFWSSPDGSTWERVVLDQPNTTVSDVVETAAGYVAVGGTSDAEGCGVGLPACAAIVFTSADGRAWQREEVRIPAGLNVPDVFTHAIVVGGRIIAISQELDGQRQAPPGEPTIDSSGAGFWSSIDGLTWTPIEGIPQEFAPSSYQPIAANPDRVVILGVIVGDVNGRVAVSPKG